MNIWALIAIMEEKNISTYNLSKLSKMDSSNLNRIINKKVKNPKIDIIKYEIYFNIVSICLFLIGFLNFLTIVNSNDKKASYYSTLIYCIKNYSLTWIIRLFSRITCLWKKFYNFTLNSII